MFESHLIGTGFGGFLVHPLMERELEKIDGRPTKEQATEILERALKVLYYRDKTTYNKWSIGTTEKVSIKQFKADLTIVLEWFFYRGLAGACDELADREAHRGIRVNSRLRAFAHFH